MATLTVRPGACTYRPTWWDRFLSVCGVVRLIEPHELIAGTPLWVGHHPCPFAHRGPMTNPLIGIGGVLPVQTAEEFGRVEPHTVIQPKFLLYSRS